MRTHPHFIVRNHTHPSAAIQTVRQLQFGYGGDMPTEQSNNTNQYRCDACGRHMNTPQELAEHRKECAAARQTGASNKPDANAREEGEDREWVSTP